MDTTEKLQISGVTPRLGIDTLDRSHQDLMDALLTLLTLADDQFLRRYPELVNAIEQNFRQEETMLERLDLPSFQAHVEQHACVLKALHHTVCSLMPGDIATGRRAIRLLADWFPLHIDIMHRQLAQAIDATSRRRFRTDNPESSD